MWDFLTSPVAQVVLWVVALLVLMAISYYLLRRYRDRIDEDVLGPNEWLDNYREMHAEGDISESLCLRRKKKQVRRSICHRQLIPLKMPKKDCLGQLLLQHRSSWAFTNDEAPNIQSVVEKAAHYVGKYVQALFNYESGDIGLSLIHI